MQRSHASHPELTTASYLAKTRVAEAGGDLLEVAYGSRNPATGAFAVDQLIAAFSDARRDRIQHLSETAVAGLDSQLAETRMQLGVANELVHALPDDPSGLTSRTFATTRLGSLQTQRDAIVVATLLESDAVSVVDQPHVVVRVRNLGNQLRGIGAAGAAGCIVGMALAWVLARRRPRIESAEQVEFVLGVPILARVLHTSGSLVMAATHVMKRLPNGPNAGRVVGIASTSHGSDPGAVGPISLRMAGELTVLSGNGVVLVPDHSNVLGDQASMLSGITVVRPQGRSFGDTLSHTRFCSAYTIVPLPALPTLEGPQTDSSPSARAMFDHVDAVVALVDHHSLIEDIQHAREALLLTGTPLIGFIYLDSFRLLG